jgi:endonuclease-3 related protein
LSRLTSKHKKTILIRVFDTLLAHYGHQHWWPGDTPFEISIGAILTQNTSWRNVERAIACLKDQRCLSVRAIFTISQAKLGQLIRSSGFYTIKAKRLKAFVQFLVDRYGGNIEKMKHKRVDVLREELLGVKGIGDETADSILLYALEKPVFVIDAYTRRIFSRHGLIDQRAAYGEIKDLFEQHLAKDVKRYNEYHALLVKLGKERCRAQHPLCDGCPLNVREFYA